MGIGVGNTFYSQKQSAGGIQAADNGLSIAGTTVILGGQLNTPLTVIDIANQEFFVQNTGIANRYIELSSGINRYTFGIIDTNTNLIQGYSAEPDTSIIYAGALGEALRITTSQALYQFGNFTGIGSSYLSINDNSGDIILSNGNFFILRSENTAAPYTSLRSKGANQLSVTLQNNSKEIQMEAPGNPGGVAIRMNGQVGVTGVFAVGANTITVEGGIVTSIV